MTRCSNLTFRDLVDEDVENQLLGAILTESRLLDEIAAILPDATVFSTESNRYLYALMLDIYDDTNNFNVFDVIERAGGAASEGAAKCGGAARLIGLADSVPTTAHAVRHAEALRSLKRRRTLMDACNKTTSMLPDRTRSDEVITTQLEQALLNADNLPADDVSSISDGLSEFMEEAVSEDRQEQSTILPTQIRPLNELIGGLSRKDLIVVGAPPSMGKTSFAIGLALQVARQGGRVLYFALDESNRAICRRILANITGIPAKVIRDGGLNDGEQDRLKSAAHLVAADNRIFITDAGSLSPIQIAAKARRTKRRHGLDLIVVDYLQQVRSVGRFETRSLAIGETVRLLKEIAKELDVVCVALSQFNREWADLDPEQLPRKSMLRDSGTIEQEANVILFPWIPAQIAADKLGIESPQYQEALKRANGQHPKAKIKVDKNKEGETGIVECRFDPVRMTFYSEQ